MSISVIPSGRVHVRSQALVHILVMAGLFIAVSARLPASEIVGAGYGPKMVLLGRMLLLVAAAGWMLRSAGRRWGDVGLRRPRRWWLVGLAVVTGYFVLGALTVVLHRTVLPVLGLAPPDISAFAALRGDLAEYLFWALPVAFGSAAFGEELVARGFLTDRISVLLGESAPGWTAAFAAVLFQGFLFGACHAYQGLAGALLAGAVGMVLGLVWLLSGRNLWAAIILHGLIDFVSMTAFYTGALGGQT